MERIRQPVSISTNDEEVSHSFTEREKSIGTGRCDCASTIVRERIVFKFSLMGDRKSFFSSGGLFEP